MTAPLLQARHLSKSYVLGGNHKVHALRDASMELQQGSWLAITGPSGSGKSTLLALLAGLDRPTSGEVFLDGTNISQANDVRLARYRKEKIGIIFQEYQLFEELSSLENVAMPLVVTAMAVARALVHDPEIIFADEPTSNIDQKAADLVMDLFHSFKQSGKSLIVISHSKQLSMAADTRIQMESGRIVQ